MPEYTQKKAVTPKSICDVRLTQSVSKALKTIPEPIQKKVVTFLKSMQECGTGYILEKYSNSGQLKSKKTKTYHCHLKKGKPTYVVIWTETTANQVTIEYIGTHEKAPY